MAQKIDVIYEDDRLIAVNKPAGLLTIPDRFRKDLSNLKDQLERKFGDLFTVHRLDRNTSGGILFAKNAEAHRELSQMFMDRIPEKYYLAVVDGTIKEDKGWIDAPLAESMTTRGKMLVHTRGKESKSFFTVKERFDRFTLVQVRIYTGRLHQVRVHMAHLGHPLLVDSLYGKREEFFLSEVKGRKYRKNKEDEERPLLKRQPLHSVKLILPNYNSDTPLLLDFPIPKDMKAIINQLRKWTK